MSWPESKMVQQKRNLPLNKWGVYPKKFLEKVFYIWIKLEIETVFVFLCPLINELEYMQLVQKHINSNTFSSILQVPAFPFRHFVRQNLTIYKTCASARHKSGCAHSHPRGGWREWAYSAPEVICTPAWKLEEGPSSAQGCSWPHIWGSSDNCVSVA